MKSYVYYRKLYADGFRYKSIVTKDKQGKKWYSSKLDMSRLSDAKVRELRHFLQTFVRFIWSDGTSCSDSFMRSADECTRELARRRKKLAKKS